MEWNTQQKTFMADLETLSGYAIQGAGRTVDNPFPMEDIDNLVSNIEKELNYRIPKTVAHGATLYRCLTCPTCGNVVSRQEQWGDSKITVIPHYCQFCGQALENEQKDKIPYEKWVNFDNCEDKYFESGLNSGFRDFKK